MISLIPRPSFNIHIEEMFDIPTENEIVQAIQNPLGQSPVKQQSKSNFMGKIEAFDDIEIKTVNCSADTE